MFATEPDTQEVPPANQISRRLSRDLVGDDGSRSEAFQHLRAIWPMHRVESEHHGESMSLSSRFAGEKDTG